MNEIELPESVDPQLWFTSDAPVCGGGRDYLVASIYKTFPGRMAAYCPHDSNFRNYRISFSELPNDLPPESRAWVQGFLSGNVPENTAWDEDKHTRQYLVYERAAEEFLRTGYFDSTILQPRPREAPARRYLRKLARGATFGHRPGATSGSSRKAGGDAPTRLPTTTTRS